MAELALPDKRQVAASFSRAARAYDGVAGLQRDVGHGLLRRLPEQAVARWIDLGCGTGYFARQLSERYPGAERLALDIAEGMLDHARSQASADVYIAGDAENLPLAEGVTDLLFTSLAVQWCEDFAAVLAEARRVLRPGGVFAFASLCQGTLAELRDSWQRVDAQVHVNRFRSFEAYEQLCGASGLRQLELAQVPHVLHFPTLRQLTGELKTLGAHNLNPGRPQGLTGRRRLLALAEAYEAFRQPEGLPATYQVVYGVFRKE